MAVDSSPAVPRQVLHDRQDATGQQAFRHRPGKDANLAWFAAIGAVADHLIAAGDWDVPERQTVDIDTHGLEVGSDQTATEAGGSDADSRLAVIEFAVARPGGI